MTPSHIGKYEIQRRLTAGGMGSLYLGRDPGLDRLVAIKTLKDEYQDDPDLRERFTREARAVARLRHPNIIIVFEIGESGGQPFIAMEYIAGETLASVVRRQPPLPLPRRLGLIEDLCLGLAHAHGAGIIHRDIKPANIMLDGDGVLKILDFGIARHGDSGMTQDGMMMGTVNYMSPEQVVGHGVDHRSDIFATGAVLYELIALEQAFPGRIDGGVLQRILSDGPAPLEDRVPGVDAELVRIVRHALEREPKRRYQDANAMRRDVARVRRRLVEEGAAPGDALDPTTTERPRPPTPGEVRKADSDRPKRLTPERFAELRRQQVDEYLRFAQEAFARGDHDAALQHAERAATVDPDSRAAIDLIDKSRFAIEAKAVRQLLSEAQRLISDGQIDDAAALTDEASVTFPDIEEAVELREEVRRTVEQIAGAREREQRIAASLERARSSIEHGGYETALRAVYEVLALDPERPEARSLEQQAKSHLQAQREHERARQDAHAQLTRARAMAAEGQYDKAVEAVNAVRAPSDTVRLAAADVLAVVHKAQRQSAQAAIVVRAREAFEGGNYSEALSALDSIPSEDETADARALRGAIETALRDQRELERKRDALDAALATIQTSITAGDLTRARQRLEDAVKIGLEDPRLATMRGQIAELETTAQAKRQQDARDRLAAKRVEAARQLLTNGDGYAAVALLERDGSGHPLVEQTLREIRVAIAEQEARVRQAAERQRQEEEARRRAEQEAARLLGERRKAEEQARVAAERQAQLAEENRSRAAERRALEEAVTGFVTKAQQEKAHEIALNLLNEALTLAPDDPRVRTLFNERLVALERQRQDEEQRREAARRREEERRAREAESQRQAEIAAAQRQEEARAAEEQRREADRRRDAARRQEEEARKIEETITKVLTEVRTTAEHEEALRLLGHAEALAPGDHRIQTLIRERKEAGETQRVEEARAREAERRERELAEQRERDARAATLVQKAHELFAAGEHEEAVTLLKTGSSHPLTREALDQLEARRLEIERERAREGRVRHREERHAALAGALHRAASDRRVHVAVVAVLSVALVWGFWQFGNLSLSRDDGLVQSDSADGQAIRETPTQDQTEREVPATGQAERQVPATDRAENGRLATDQAERERLAKEQAEREKLAKDQVARDQTAKDQAARDQAAKDQAARDQVAREQAARDQAAKEQAARDQAAKDQEARDQAARDQAARDQAARDEAARDQAAGDRASIELLLDQYVSAYARMDESRLRAIDPGFRGIPRRELIRSVVLTISRKTVTVAPDGQSAVLMAYGDYRYVWERAVLPPSSAAQLTWRLRKVGSNWVVAQ